MRVSIAVALALVACTPEKTGSVAGPPLTAVPATSTASAASSSAPPETSSAPAASSSAPSLFAPGTTVEAPVRASFVDAGQTVAMSSSCERLFLAVAEGKLTAMGEKLDAGDMLITDGPAGFHIEGQGSAVAAFAKRASCDKPEIAKKVIRGKSVPELTFADGKMHAHLDFEEHPTYAGRLSGTAPVAEHSHRGTWEILCAIEASGTFTLDGKAMRLGPKQVVVVPPDFKHSWTPDPGSNLRAIQFYDPPGPQARFRAAAAPSR